MYKDKGLLLKQRIYINYHFNPVLQTNVKFVVYLKLKIPVYIS